MTTVAIMQPTYIPWLGYFDLMDQVDHFVLLDSVQFSHQSWQHRNRVRTAQGLTWLTIPVLTKGRSGQRIDEVELRSGSGLAASHGRTVEQAYAHAPHAADPIAAFTGVLDTGEAGGRLVDVTVPAIDLLCDQLGLATPHVRSSTLPGQGRRSVLLIELLEHLGADTYLSPAGAVDYLSEDRQLFEEAGIDVLIQDFVHPQYDQQYMPFEPFASTLDLVCNSGPGALELIRGGRRDPRPLAAHRS